MDTGRPSMPMWHRSKRSRHVGIFARRFFPMWPLPISIFELEMLPKGGGGGRPFLVKPPPPSPGRPLQRKEQQPVTPCCSPKPPSFGHAAEKETTGNPALFSRCYPTGLHTKASSVCRDECPTSSPSRTCPPKRAVHTRARTHTHWTSHRRMHAQSHSLPISVALCTPLLCSMG